MSETYQLAHGPNPTRDPENQAWTVYPRRRLEAELIRDAMLAVADNLDRSLGGTLYTGKNLDYVRGVRYESTRRSIYLPVIRGQMFDFFQTFDFPDPCVSVGQRSSTVVAPQALLLMNNGFVVEQAKRWAKQLIQISPDTQARLAHAYLQAYGRELPAADLALFEKFIRDYKVSLAEQNLSASQLEETIWAAICQTIFASHRFIYYE